MGGIKIHTRLENFQIWGLCGNSITNILSMKGVQKLRHIIMDTSIEPALFVHHLDGSIMKFKEQESGLYIFKPNSKTSINVYPHCTLVTTIEENKMIFTKRQVCNAELARTCIIKLDDPVRMYLRIYCRPTKYTTV